MRFFIKILICILFILGLTTVVYYSLEGHINYNELLDFVVEFMSMLLFFIFLMFLAFGVISFLKLPLYIRTIRMRLLAKKLNMNFNKEYNIFGFNQPYDIKINIISGIIGGDQVEICDYINGKYAIKFGIQGLWFTTKYTLFTYNGKINKIARFFWFPEINIIENKIKSARFSEVFSAK